MFSLVCALPSPASAEACASLFHWFTGTTAQSDFSGTCMSAVWFMAFADRSCSFEQDVREISRFSCMLFLSVRGFSDYAGPNSHSRNSVAAMLPSSISEGSRHPDPSAFRSSIARPTGTSGLRFTRHLTVPPARLEARMESLFSFPVGLFHPLQHAGLSRRTPGRRQSFGASSVSSHNQFPISARRDRRREQEIFSLTFQVMFLDFSAHTRFEDW